VGSRARPRAGVGPVADWPFGRLLMPTVGVIARRRVPRQGRKFPHKSRSILILTRLARAPVGRADDATSTMAQQDTCGSRLRHGIQRTTPEISRITGFVLGLGSPQLEFNSRWPPPWATPIAPTPLRSRSPGGFDSTRCTLAADRLAERQELPVQGGTSMHSSELDQGLHFHVAA